MGIQDKCRKNKTHDSCKTVAHDRTHPWSSISDVKYEIFKVRLLLFEYDHLCPDIKKFPT